MSEEKILDCPWCGEPARVARLGELGDWAWQVRCEGDGDEAPRGPWCDTTTEAVREWNRVASMPALLRECEEALELWHREWLPAGDRAERIRILLSKLRAARGA